MIDVDKFKTSLLLYAQNNAVAYAARNADLALERAYSVCVTEALGQLKEEYELCSSGIRSELQERWGAKALHSSITAERVVETIERGNTVFSSPGICKACGEDADGVEPDARNYKCEGCGESQVFGAEELLMEMS